MEPPDKAHLEYHQPVMLQECLDGLNLKPNGIYVDATLGGGGHTRAILERLGSGARVFGFDQDEDVRKHLPQDPRFRWMPFNFRFLRKSLRIEGITKVDGILADLGVSSHQLDTPSRGFSYRFNAPLDMRMNNKGDLTAADILAEYNAEQLQNIFSQYGEVRNAKTLAQTIVEQRSRKAIETIEDLLFVMQACLKGDKFRYYAQVFQALRMEVNDELGALKTFLEESTTLLAPGGRLVVMSYHSLEDRLVKNWLRNGCFEDEPQKDSFGHFYVPMLNLTKKVIVASAEENKRNPRAHSAKLRIGERKAQNY